MVYKCIRECYAYGRKWNVGDLLESTVGANHHFVQTQEVPKRDGDLPMNLQMKGRIDPYKPNTSSSDTMSYSQVAGVHAKITTGMAAGLQDEQPITNPRQMVTKG